MRPEQWETGTPLAASQLEERILMSAAPLAMAEAPQDAAEVVDSEGSAISTNMHLLDLVADSILPTPWQSESSAIDSKESTDSASQALELVFVDSAVDNLDQLVADLKSQNTIDGSRKLEVFELDAGRNGLAQITRTLLDFDGIDGIHIVSHGSDGVVRLGNLNLSLATAAQYRSTFAAWQGSLSAEADLLLYGCNLAASDEGRELMSQIAAGCDCDVAASEDLTGHADIGGDWDLEHEIGSIEANVAFSSSLQTGWRDLLDSSSLPTAPAENSTNASGSTVDYLSASLAFEQNHGQTDDAVDFLARGSGYSVFLSDGDAVLDVSKGDTRYAVRLQLENAASAPSVTGEDELVSRSNYLIGHTSEWRTEISNFGRVRYSDVYEGIDVAYYGNQRMLEYDFIVDAGADAGQVRVRFDGSESIRIDDNGELVIQLSSDGDEIRFRAPYSFQETETGRQTVESRYRINSDGSVGFDLGEYDSSRELIIDPILDYSTFLGGLGTETPRDIAVDTSGNVYVLGQTRSMDFPGLDVKTGSLKSTTDQDIFVTKLSSDGGTVLFSTFVGGTGSDYAGGLELGPAGNIYVSGSTWSSDAPTTAGAYQTTLNGTGDGYLFLLNSTGDSLQYSTFFGGADGESGGGLFVDGAGVAYITGQTLSNDLPDVGSYDKSRTGQSDVYVAKINPAGTGAGDLLYTTYLGGSVDYEASNGIAVDSNGYIHVIGRTYSSDHPITAGTAIDATLGGADDAYLTVLDPTAGTGGLVYSTFLGGSGSESPGDIYIDSNDVVYITGGTNSTTDFNTTAGAYATSGAGLYDAFVSVIDPSISGASGLLYSTYLGGTGTDSGAGIFADAAGIIHVAGSARAAFPTVNPMQGTFGGSSDAFVARLNPAGGGANDLEFSTYLGGTGSDSAAAIVLDSSGNYYIAGSAGDATYPTTAGAYDETFNGGTSDAFVAKIRNVELIVDTTNDVVDGTTTSVAALLSNRGADGFISLREAIIATNNTTGADTIHLAAGIYALSIDGDGEAAAASGDLDIVDHLTVLGSGVGSTILNAKSLERMFEIHSGTVSFSDLSIGNGLVGAAESGGAIKVASSADLTLTDVSLQNNQAGAGGAIDSAGTLTLENATLHGNTATAGKGGGLQVAGSGTTTLTGVTISNNTAVGGNSGGGIHFAGAALTATNVTVSGNSADNRGGGIMIVGNAALQNITVTANTAAMNSGGGIYIQSGAVTMRNGLVAGNTSATGDIDVRGTVSSLGNNLIGDSTGSSGWIGSDILNVSPTLGVLGDYGGPTRTHALFAGSRGIDEGSNTGAPATDQRGEARDATTDIGAYEFADIAPVISLPGSAVSYVEGDAPAIIDATATASDADSANLAGGTLTVDFSSGGTANDRLSIRNEGIAAGRIGVTGANVTYGGTTIGTFVGGTSGSDPLVVTFNVNSTPASAQALMRNITYNNVAVDPDTDARTVRMVLTDGDGGTSAAATKSIIVSGDNILVVDIVGDVLDAPAATSIDALLADRGADGHISLREAILAVNGTANGGTPDEIHFRIPGGGPHVIQLNAVFGALPVITEAVVIDGTSEPDYTANTPVVRIDGNNLGAGSDGLTFGPTADGSTLRGLMFTRFSRDGVVVQSGADNVTIAGNWIGTDGSTSPLMGNGGDGLDIRGSNTTIGGTGANDRNVITNNGNEGITIAGSGATNHTIQGNFIGINVDGTAGSGNADVGLALISGSGNTIGGTTAAARNVISNNSENIEINTSSNIVQGNFIGTDPTGTIGYGSSADDGIEIQGGASNNRIGGTAAGAGNVIAANALDGIHINNSTGTIIQGNFIGTDVTGTIDLGNGGSGVRAGNGANNNVVGTTNPGEGNQIAFNKGDGVLIQGTAFGNSIRGNSILANGEIGIDLNSDDVTVNDSGDGDTGPNDLQNFAILTGAVTNGASVTIDGTLNSTAGSMFQLDFYASVVADATSHGEAERFLGSATVATDGSGNATFSESFMKAASAGEFITAAVTNAAGSTSELAQNVVVKASNVPPSISLPGSTINYTENDGPTIVDATAIAADADGGDFNLGTLTIDFTANGTANDRLDIRHEGAAPGQIGVSVSSVTYGGTVIGTFTGGTSGSDPLVITFNTNSSPAAAQALMRNVTYENVSENPSELSRSVRFILTDGDGGISNSASQTVNVSSLNDAPVDAPAVSGTPAEDQILTADTSGISDADGLGTLSYQWYRNVTAIGGATSATYTPGDADVGQQIRVDVSYVDGGGTPEGPLASAQTPPIANVNDAPTGAVLIDNMSPSEGDTLTASNSLADADGLTGPVTYQWQRNGADIGGATFISYTTVAADVGTLITVVASYTDDRGTPESVSSSAAGPVANVNAEEVIATNTGMIVNEGDNGTVVTPAVLETTDVDNTTSQLVYTLTSPPSAGTLRLSGSALSVNDTFTQLDINSGFVAYDHAGGEIFADSFDFRVDDGAGTFSSGTFAITILPVNDNDPVIMPGQLFSVSELATAGTALGFTAATDVDTGSVLQNWTITSGNVDGIFGLDPNTGELTVADATNLNFEATSSYLLTLTVGDGSNTSAPQTVSITIVDQNEAPVLAVTSPLRLNENSAIGTTVGSASATDEDFSDSLTYRISGSSGTFGIDGSTGQISVADAAQLDFEVTTSFTLTVEVEDLAGLTDRQLITVNLNDVNETPVALHLIGRSVAENSANGAVVGTVTGTDFDAGDILTYSLMDSAAGRFAVDSTSGLITVTHGALLNFEAASSHNIIVRTTDSGGLNYDESFTITLTNVNEAPTAAGESFSGNQLETISGGPGTLLLNDNDVDGDTLTAVLASGSANGTLILNADGSFDYTPTSSFSGMDSFTYYATDGSLNSAVVTVKINVITTIAGGPPASGDAGDSSNSDGQSDSSDSNTETENSESEKSDSENNDPVDDSEPSTELHGLNSANSAAVDPITGFVKQDITSEILRRTNSEQFVAIFLDAVPEETALQQRDANRREKGADREEGSGEAATFLFSQVTTDQPLFMREMTIHDDQQYVQQLRDRESYLSMMESVVIGSTAVAATSVSVGYIIWLLRGGSLLTAALSSLPFWQSFDPLPVLESFDNANDDDGTGESLASLVSGSN